MTRKSLLFLIILILPVWVFAQYSLPERGYVFEDRTAARVDITIDQDSLDSILDVNNLESNHEYPATFTFTRDEIAETFENVGFRLRGNTSRVSGKKSFKVSFNTFVGNGKFHGLEKMNLNGEHNDPSILRAKVCWDHYSYFGIMSARSNHVLLYINGEYKGIYINVEHIDEEFVIKRLGNNSGNLYKCLYPADLAYKGDFPDLYKEEIYGRRAYDLKTNTGKDDYSDLANFIDILNNYTGDEYQCKLEEVFDVEHFLKVIVWDILTSNWDGPLVNKNNFYLYNNPATGKFVYIPYDLDNTLGIDWGNVGWASTDIYNWSTIWGNDIPLYENIMNIKEYRDKVSLYFAYFTETMFNSNSMNAYFDYFRDLISPYRTDDVYAGYDYGWDFEDFINSYEESLGGHVKYGLKEYVFERHNSALAQLESSSALASIESYGAKISGSSANFTAKIFWHSIIEGTAKLHFQRDDGTWHEMEMNSNDQYNYSSLIDFEGASVINYYIESENSGGSRIWPICNYKSIYFELDVENPVVINEFMASNDSGEVDEFGEYEDWIEIYNSSDEAITLSKVYLTDNSNTPGKWELPTMTLSSDSYLTLYADNDTEQGLLHTNFKLSKDGEFLGIYQKVGDQFFAIDSISFPAQESNVSYGRLPNGTGEFQVLPYPTFGYNNEEPQSTDETEKLSDFMVFPNPTNSVLNIEYIGRKNFIYTVALFPVTGAAPFYIRYKDWSTGTINLRNLGLTPGIYFLNIKLNDGSSEIIKIVFTQ